MNNEQQQPMGYATLKVTRPGFYGCVLAVTITIDGYMYSVETKNPLVLQLVPGVHSILLDTPKSFGIPHQETFNINMVSGGNYEINLKADIICGGFKINQKTSKLN